MQAHRQYDQITAKTGLLATMTGYGFLRGKALR